MSVCSQVGGGRYPDLVTLLPVPLWPGAWSGLGKGREAARSTCLTMPMRGYLFVHALELLGENNNPGFESSIERK